ncbi:MAG: hypothetical protein SFY92_09695 [Verrucomicrobiae bacterium]|nr:hypothetical protein [Verrucomicrobiae bacterium]
MKNILSLLLMILALGLFTGCGGTPSGANKDSFDRMILSDDTEFYKDGPTVYSSPDGRLSRGTRCRVVGSAGQYLQIELTNGKTVYVNFASVGPLSEDSQAARIRF